MHFSTSGPLAMKLIHFANRHRPGSTPTAYLSYDVRCRDFRVSATRPGPTVVSIEITVYIIHLVELGAKDSGRRTAHAMHFARCLEARLARNRSRASIP